MKPESRSQLINQIQNSAKPGTHSDTPVIDDEEAEERASGYLEQEGGVIAETGGTTGQPKTYEYPADKIERMRDASAQTFILAGIQPEGREDKSLNLGNNLPHLSGWLIDQAFTGAGIPTLNSNARDYQGVIEAENREGSFDYGRADEVVAAFSTPSLFNSVGQQVEENYGDPAEVFPNLDYLLTGGEVLTDDMERGLLDLFDAETIIDTYVSTELGWAAVDAEERKEGKLPFENFLDFEVMTDDGVQPLQEFEEEDEGVLVATDPGYEPVTRMNTGDYVRVIPGDEVNRFENIGRIDGLNPGGAPLRVGNVDEAVQRCYGEVDDWLMVVEGPSMEPSLSMYVLSPEQRDSFEQYLYEINEPVRQASEEVGIIQDVNEVTYSEPRNFNRDTEEFRSEGFKQDRIVEGPNYKEEA